MCIFDSYFNTCLRDVWPVIGLYLNVEIKRGIKPIVRELHGIDLCLLVSVYKTYIHFDCSFCQVSSKSLGASLYWCNRNCIAELCTHNEGLLIPAFNMLKFWNKNQSPMELLRSVCLPVEGGIGAHVFTLTCTLWAASKWKKTKMEDTIVACKLCCSILIALERETKLPGPGQTIKSQLEKMDKNAEMYEKSTRRIDNTDVRRTPVYKPIKVE